MPYHPDQVPPPVPHQPPPQKPWYQVTWYYQKWFVVLSLLVFFPLGLVLLWTSPVTQKSGRIVWSVLVALAVVVSLGGSEDTAPTSDRKAGQEAGSVGVAVGAPKAMVPAYEVASREDISVATATRLRVSLVVPVGSSESEIRTAVEDYVRKESKASKLNAIAIFIYDRANDAGNAFTLARVEWAPNGIWADAVKVRAGDYKSHLFVWEFRKKVVEPGGVVRPSDEDFALFDRLMDLLHQNPDEAESVLIERLAQETGASIARINEVATKVLTWRFY